MDNQNGWQVATLVKSEMVASDVKSLVFKVDNWIQHNSGQHYSLKLTSSDGYMAERDYSIASAPEQVGEVEFGVQILKDGEVSPYLFALKPGEQIEIKGPIGGHFIWDKDIKGPLVLIGGGSGMVPLMSILRHKHNLKDERETIFLISAKSQDKILYKTEIEDLEKADKNLKVVKTFTKNPPNAWAGYNERFDKEILEKELGHIKQSMPIIYICGPTPFVEDVADALLEVGFNSHQIRTERFG